MGNRLSDHDFCSPYRGYLVNIRHIQTIQPSNIVIANGTLIPISRRKVTTLQQLYANRIIHVLK